MLYKIIPNRRGYYELWVDGRHVGNFDTREEAKVDLVEEAYI
ncbi:MAG: hypothetical protein ACYCVD_04075 [Desulfitobacteriaceae bacterium]